MLVVERESLIHGGKEMQLSFDDHPSIVAVGFNKICTMGHNDHGSISALFEELDLAAFVKALVADGDNFVDQVTIELNDHRKREGKSSAHAGGVALHGLAQVGTKLGELLDKRDFVFGGGIVNPADEAQIIQTCERPLKAAAKGERPRDPHRASHRPRSGTLGSTNKSDEGGFATAVTAEYADFFSATHPQVNVVQDDPIATVNGVALINVRKLNHGIKKGLRASANQ